MSITSHSQTVVANAVRLLFETRRFTVAVLCGAMASRHVVALASALAVVMYAFVAKAILHFEHVRPINTSAPRRHLLHRRHNRLSPRKLRRKYPSWPTPNPAPIGAPHDCRHVPPQRSHAATRDTAPTQPTSEVRHEHPQRHHRCCSRSWDCAHHMLSTQATFPLCARAVTGRRRRPLAADGVVPQFWLASWCRTAAHMWCHAWVHAAGLQEALRASAHVHSAHLAVATKVIGVPRHNRHGENSAFPHRVGRDAAVVR